MKKLFTIALLVCCVSAAGFAQTKEGEGKKQHGQRFESERIAYLSQKMNLTPEEAQAFWPIYNVAEAEQKELNKAVRTSLKALNEAFKEKMPETEISTRLDNYLKALDSQKNVHIKYAAKYKKAVGVEKTAKFYRAYESFRRQQIKSLRGQGHPGMHNGGQPRQLPRDVK